MKYIMFADTLYGEFMQIVHAQDDDTALVRMDVYLRSIKIDPRDVYCVAGVWEKNEKFYTATKMSDLER